MRPALRITLFTICLLTSLSLTGLARRPSAAPATAPALIFGWAKTWNHQVGPVTSPTDALDVAIAVFPMDGQVGVFGYAEAPSPYSGALDATPFLTRFAPDGTIVSSGLLNFLSGRLDRVAPTGELRYLSGHEGYHHWLTFHENAGYGLSADIAVDNWVGAGEAVLSLTAHAGYAYVLTDRFFITRWNGTGSIQQWTHEIHLGKFEQAASGGWATVAQVWDTVLTPEVSGILASDDTGLYVLGGPVFDYDINTPPNTTAPKSITKFDFGGTLLWARPLGQNTATKQFGYTSLAVESDGFYLAGVSQPINPDKTLGPSDLLVTKLDTTGSVVWSQTYDADAPGLSKWAPMVDLGTTGIYVAGTLTTANAYPYDSDVIVLKLELDGSPLATARWGEAEDEYPKAAVVIDDALYVAGYSSSGDPPGGGDAFLVKYVGSDLTAPWATPTQLPAPTGAGWNSTDVTVTWHWSDGAEGAGIDWTNCTTSSTSTFEGTSVLGATCQDLAGNVGTASYTVMVDKTPPALAPIVTPTPILLGGAATATPGATDDLSGVAQANCGAIDTASAGAKTVTCMATDNAGNTAVVDVVYQVGYAFSGFLAPVDGPPFVNAGRSGRVYPIRFQLLDAQGAPVRLLSAVAGVSYRETACTAFAADAGDTLELTASGPAGLRYDLAEDQYIYNWATPGAGCVTLFLTLDSGQVFEAYFSLSGR